MARIRHANHKNLKVTYRKRRGGLLKKARELSILCGIQVLLICISQAGEVDTWPEDAEEVLDAIARYRGCSQADRDKHKDHLISYLVKQKSKRDPNRQILADLAQRTASKLDAIRIRIRNLTNMSNASESNRDEKFEEKEVEKEKFEEVENITNPQQSTEPDSKFEGAENITNPPLSSEPFEGVENITNPPQSSEPDSKFEGVENITNPPDQSSEPDSSTVESNISQAESAANNVVQHQQQYYNYAYVPYGYAIPPYGYAIPYLLAPPAGPSSDPKNVNDAAAALAFQPPILLWPQIPATSLRSSPERMTPEDNVPTGGGGGGGGVRGGEAEEEVDTQLRLGLG